MGLGYKDRTVWFTKLVYNKHPLFVKLAEVGSKTKLFTPPSFFPGWTGWALYTMPVGPLVSLRPTDTLERKNPSGMELFWKNPRAEIRSS